ncbi:MAG: hypothetical protein EAZ30_03290 [Betaproteobacteria bacterium]|nr:MAG: hypothetical protein EAZ30_03290 [Betaproteobacteria bacterium]
MQIKANNTTVKNAVLALLLGAAFLNGCQTSPTADRKTEQAAEVARLKALSPEALANVAMAAADKRWQQLVAGEYKAAFESFTAASKVGIDSDFLLGYVTNLNAKGAKSRSAKCEAARCEVKMDLTVNIKIPKIAPRLMEIPHREVWVLDDTGLKMIRGTAR